MSAVEVARPTTVRPERAPSTDGVRRDLAACRAALGDAVDAANVLGIPTADAEAVAADADRRLGFPSDAYVLALVGGTGVGKSSVLNALAGDAVSAASVRRPTTGRPVAWIPRGTRADLEPLLEWLGVGEVREHGAANGPDARSGDDAQAPNARDGLDARTVDPLPTVAILDLPDIDSLEASHRAAVEAVLPRVDAVAWVTDPEKYHDAILHDEFLRRWVPRLDRQVAVLNKVDRLAEPDVRRVQRDLGADLARLANGDAAPLVIATSAATGSLDDLRRWLAAETEAKRVVRARIAAAIAASVRDLAAAAGVDPGVPARPFVDPAARDRALARMTDAVLDVVDLRALRDQAVAATRARARRRGTGPIGIVTSALYRLSGREARVADPHGYLVRWRDRGSLAHAVEPLRELLTEPVRRVPAPVRPALAASVEPRQVDTALAGAVDRVVVRTPSTPPSSLVWPVIGVLQSITTLVLVVAVAWIVVWVLAHPPVDSVLLPVVGRVPVPFVLLVGALVVGYLLARLLGLHAGWLGRRWARRLADDVARSVTAAVTETALAPLDVLEGARWRLWNAATEATRACR